MKTFKEFLLEYERTDNVVPSHVNEEDLDHDHWRKNELGKVHGYRVVHYESRMKNKMHHTFVSNEHGDTIGHIGHKKPTVAGRLAISDVTKRGETPKGLMSDVLHHLVKHGHTLESDNSNTESATKMLHHLTSHPDVKTHIENGKGEKIHHEGDIASKENQDKYAIHSDHKDFLEPGNMTHKHVLVFSKKA